MYFDAVLDFNMKPLFNGTPEETTKWLLKQPDTFLDQVRVCIGYSMEMVSATEYLKRQ